jgi:hypothetical protein
LRLAWSAYNGSMIRFWQSKSNADAARHAVNLVNPVGAPLKTMLDRTPKRSPLIFINSEGRPWTGDGYLSSWRKACANAGITGMTFNKRNAVTRLASVGRTEAQIATLTGHALCEVCSILDAHYIHRT